MKIFNFKTIFLSSDQLSEENIAYFIHSNNGSENKNIVFKRPHYLKLYIY